MPGTFAALDQNLPRFTGQESLERRVQLLQDYQYQLLEQLRYILSHLDLRHFNQTALQEWTAGVTDPIYRKISDAEGNITQLEITAKGIQSQVNDNQGNISILQQTAASLSTQISNANGDISRLQQTATSLSTQISNANGDISRLQQTATSLSTQISNANGDISALQQTASRLSTQISNANGDISRLEQTASSLSSEIYDPNGAVSRLRQTVNSISLSVSNRDGCSMIYLKRDGITIASQEIEFLGTVTFRDLSGNGTSVINGGNITTGIITANYVGVDGCFALYGGGIIRGYMGCGYGESASGQTSGAWLGSANGSNYLLASDGGVRMQDGFGGAIWVTNGNCFCSSEMRPYSDRRLKEDIDHDLECYKAFFRALRPCRFLWKARPEEGYHMGFIAQEVEEAMDMARLSPMDFAGLARVRLPDGSEGYALGYGGFSALNTYMIQYLDKRVSRLEERNERDQTAS